MVSACCQHVCTGTWGTGAGVGPLVPCHLLLPGTQVLSSSHVTLVVPFICRVLSYQTTSNNVQSIIESRVEKRTKGVYVPFGGKSMITFMDDLNMPAKDMFGSQPPLELIRLWIDYGFWYDRVKQTIKHIRVSVSETSVSPVAGGLIPPPLDPWATQSYNCILLSPQKCSAPF